MLTYIIGSNNRFSSLIATIGNILKITINSDSQVLVSINGFTSVVTQITNTNIYIVEQTITDNLINGNLSINISNQSNSLIDTSILISKDQPIISVIIESNVIPRIGETIKINLTSTKDLIDYPKISHSSVRSYAIDNLEELSRDLVIWNKIDARTWTGIFTYDNSIALENFFITCLDIAGNIGTYANYSIAEFSKDISVSLSNNKSLGKYLNGQIISAAGKTLQEVLIDISQELQFPSLIDPIFSVDYSFAEHSLDQSLQIIGNTLAIWINFSVDKGLIKGKLDSGIWQSELQQNFRVGNLTYNYLENLLDGTISHQFAGFIFIQNVTSILGNISYLIGSQPLDSQGNNFSSPTPLGSINVNKSFEGVYPIFSTSVEITTQTSELLYSMIEANNIVLSLIGEVDNNNKQTFWIPKIWIDSRPLTQIRYLSSLSNRFDFIDRLSDFTVSNVLINIFGFQIDYIKYTYNGIRRGDTRLKLIF